MKRFLHLPGQQEIINMITYAVAGFIMTARSSAFSGIQEEFSLSYSSISMLILVSGLLMQVSTFSAGFTIKKYGHRLNIGAGLLVFGSAFLLIYFSDSFYTIFAGFCVMMLGFGTVVLSLNMYTGLLGASSPDREPGPALMRLHLGFSLGALAGPGTISLFITTGMGWRFIYILSAVMIYILSAFYFKKTGKHSLASETAPGPQVSECTGAGQREKDLERDCSSPSGRIKVRTAFILFVIIFIAGQIWEYGFGTWFVIFAKQHFALSEISASAYLTIYWLCFPVSRISAGWFVKKTGPVFLLALSFTVVSLFAAGGFIFSLPILFSLSGFFTALLYPLGMALMQQTFGRQRSDLVGFISMTGGVVNYLLISLAGTIADSCGIAAGFGSISVYLLAGIAASVFLGIKLSAFSGKGRIA